jgi:hypothetical protein
MVRPILTGETIMYLITPSSDKDKAIRGDWPLGAPVSANALSGRFSPRAWAVIEALEHGGRVHAECTFDERNTCVVEVTRVS